MNEAEYTMMTNTIKVNVCKMLEKKRPLLEKRAKILKGEITDFSEYIPLYEAAVVEVTTMVAGIVKTDEEIEAEHQEKPHEPTNVDHLKEV